MQDSRDPGREFAVVNLHCTGQSDASRHDAYAFSKEAWRSCSSLRFRV